MSTLHLVRQSAFRTNDFEQCLSIIAPQDTIVLMDDGCYNLQHPLTSSFLTYENNEVTIACIGTHAQGRAIINIQEAVKKIEMAEVVELTFTHKKVITWQ